VEYVAYAALVLFLSYIIIGFNKRQFNKYKEDDND